MRLQSCRLQYFCGIVLVSSFLLFSINIFELQCLNEDESIENPGRKYPLKCLKSEKFKYKLYGRGVDGGHLKHVIKLLELYGYERNYNANSSDWDLMWAHDYPFRVLSSQMRNLNPHQKVNHFPGTGFITNKMDLAMSDFPFIPKSFRIPNQKEAFYKYTSEHPSKNFVQKNNDHRGITIKDVKHINFNETDSFIQEYIDNPFLVDGYKFDIGVYTIITSFDPLRVYIYNGDALFRYCAEKYYPFDPKNLDKYVVGDNYLPTWDVPSLKFYYENLGFSMKESFNGYMASKGRNYSKIWTQIEDAIRKICLNKEPKIMKYVNIYKSKRNFFEMVRFDFVVDDDLNVYVMEVNMSPNLSSAHFLQNQILYEQVLHNMFSLLNLGFNTWSMTNDDIKAAEKNIVVSPHLCSKCELCVAPECQLCLPCMSHETKETLKEAYIEHMSKRDCKRIFPVADGGHEIYDDTLSPENLLLTRWYNEKCKSDKSWCL